MKRIGLHLRVYESLLAVVHKAIEYQLPFFQCFLLSVQTKKLIRLTHAEKNEFAALRDRYFSYFYVHGSYWINLAGKYNNGYTAFMRELCLAKELSATHFIIHPGFAHGAQKKEEGIDTLARMLNKIIQRESAIQLVLENTAHGNLTIGSDLEDFKKLCEKIDKPERISFCIDTSHAFAYGYDIVTSLGLNTFVAHIDKTIGLSSVHIIHLNDTDRKKGSRIDCHALIGQGTIGEHALRAFMLHPQLLSIPIVLEPPLITAEEERLLIQKIHSWNLEKLKQEKEICV